VLGPLRALEQPPGPQRLRLVLAGSGAAGDQPRLRGGQRARSALPPGDHRPGGGHPERAVPRAVLARPRQRRGLQRAITGDHWPTKETRRARLGEAVAVIRALLAGETVSHDGLVKVDRARLWTLPERPPELIGAAISAETAAWVGGWADGLVTLNQPHDQLRKLIDAFRAGGGEGKPLYLQVHLSWAADEETALAVAHDQWQSNVFDPALAMDLVLPEQFDAAARFVTPEDVRSAVLVSADLGRHTAWLGEYLELGFDRIYLHEVGQAEHQQPFIDAFGSKVVPELTGRGGPA
jgi:G6PDH family F420-dependent oxidoreductase